MESQQHVTDMGGTMRLGATRAASPTGRGRARRIGADEVSERHRHRYEVSNRFRDTFAAPRLVPRRTVARRLARRDRRAARSPWFVSCQFHPELKSRPNRRPPLFAGFIGAGRGPHGSTPRSAQPRDRQLVSAD
jgi:CTP synthase